ncbi:D-beta-hydroxybutyrate dehydrogenase, mitochondrial-like [Saccoglossus kowalevskii]|uniref:D-beta-hydroxybutyrate dehydrogenase, mitochondrial-like n=1 Tax=Saccoglossus kowalevskii TaxID=10224 RepID=A0ABM0MTV7_SACKO|nr:PREDICTED: D-beta-hydroxybutyrate dehydrogenase, mitochondrial-like [Saccoglossus kowalevskii]
MTLSTPRQLEASAKARTKLALKGQKRFRDCYFVFMLLLVSAAALVIYIVSPELGGSRWAILSSGAFGWVSMYLFLCRYFPRFTWYGYGPVTPIKKSIIVTNGDSELGYYLAKELDMCMFSSIFVGSKHPDKGYVKRLVDECTKKVVVIPLDVTSDESVAKAMELINDCLDRRNNELWGVVNNAAVTSWGEIEWLPLETYKNVAEVNVYGVVRVIKAVLPLIRRIQGRIVNVNDVRGLSSVPGCAAFSMTKYAMESFSDTLRYEMKQWDVKYYWK